MKKTKFIVAAVLAAALVPGVIAGCTGNGDDGLEGTPGKTYTFEAEGCDLSGLSSFGYSVNVNETDMIQGKNVASMPDAVKNSLSNGYFIGYFQTKNEDGLTLKFPIDADKASTGNRISLRLARSTARLRYRPRRWT